MLYLAGGPSFEAIQKYAGHKNKATTEQQYGTLAHEEEMVNIKDVDFLEGVVDDGICESWKQLSRRLKNPWQFDIRLFESMQSENSRSTDASQRREDIMQQTELHARKRVKATHTETSSNYINKTQ